MEIAGYHQDSNTIPWLALQGHWRLQRSPWKCALHVLRLWVDESFMYPPLTIFSCGSFSDWLLPSCFSASWRPCENFGLLLQGRGGKPNRRDARLAHE